MASLKDLQNRIKSVKSIQKITKAMQMVATAKLRKAQDAAERARPYSDRIGAVIANLSASMVGEGGAGSEGAPKLLVGNGKTDVHLLVVATADRGLCGGFNTNIVRKAREEIVKLEGDGKTVKVFCIGRIGEGQLNRLYGDKIIKTVSLKEHKTLTGAIAAELGGEITAMFDAGEFDVCKLIYSQFENVMTQVPTIKTMIPAIGGSAIDDMGTQSGEGGNHTSDDVFAPDLKGAAYEYEPDEEGILKTLLPRNINTQILSALLENVAGEMGSKMAAMDNSTRAAGDLIDKLTLTFNRSRQAQITSELIEIISGAEAL
ncbi:MAG: F0F1 ATP synthase subunit gamma [Robiginitomaculum sp.]|nr:F0F1 ATP synthase subunit gamma [Robiginitomaculum sp.]